MQTKEEPKILPALKLIVNKIAIEPNMAHDFELVKKLFVKVVYTSFIYELVSMLSQVPFKMFVDQMTSGHPTAFGLVLALLLLGAAKKLLTEADRKVSFPQDDFLWILKMILNVTSLRHLLKQDHGWHVLNSTGEKDSKVFKNLIKTEELRDRVIYDSILAALRFVILTCALFYLGRPFGIAALAAIVISGFMIWRSEKKLTDYMTSSHDRNKALEKRAEESSKSWKLAKNAGLESYFADAYEREFREHVRLSSTGMKEYMRYRLYQSDALNVSQMLGLSLAVPLILNKPDVAGIGRVVLAVLWLMKFYDNFEALVQYGRVHRKSKNPIVELSEFLSREPSVNPNAQGWRIVSKGKIELIGVTKKYPGSDREALRQVSCVFPVGSYTALTGPTGSGKSTLIKALLREFDPCEGEVLLDGIDLREYDREFYCQHSLSIVEQEIILIDGSVAFNIGLGRLDATFEQIVDAARRAGALEFITEMPMGFDTQIGDNGIRLSGGQQQRLAIARALVRKAPILILDEPTSALDAMSQAYFQDTLRSLRQDGGLTIILIAHRLSTVVDADSIIVLDKGEIVEQGTHKELIVSGGIYQQNFEMEMGLLD